MDKNTKIYRVNFDVKCYCKGIWCYAEGHISIPATSEKEAIKMVKEGTEFEMVNMKATDVTPWNNK